MMLAALLFACPALAQETPSVSDYRLPPKSSTAPSNAEGPVDPEHPVATPTRPAPEPTSAPPTTASATPTPTPTPSSAVPVSRAVVQPSRPPASGQPPATAAAGAPASSPVPAPPVPTPEVDAWPTAAPAPPAPAAAPGERPSVWLLLAGAAVIALAGLGYVLWLRRASSAPAAQPSRGDPEGEAPAPASAPATLTPIGQATRRPLPAAVVAADPLAFVLEPRSLRLSVVYATLSYRLELTNGHGDDLRDVVVAGDIISAHSSVPMWQQLSLEAAPLERRHEAALLASGEAIPLTGELRIPLAEVLPLRAGTALLYAPLARFLVEARRDGAGAYRQAHIFTLGQPSTRRGETMQPFRLDLGPQLFTQVEHREVDIARWLQLAEERRAS